MPDPGYLIILFDAPTSPEFDEWFYAEHYQDVLRTPGVTAFRRLAIQNSDSDRHRFMGLIETADVEATLAARASEAGQRSQQEANRHGVRHRTVIVTRTLFEALPGAAPRRLA
ncbi:MAG: hypothetical protein M5U01_32460 [Ardenticatenaceae bacterium]|nr:hypothetical protein [Ardenticatenaceae bacterium]